MQKERDGGGKIGEEDRRRTGKKKGSKDEGRRREEHQIFNDEDQDDQAMWMDSDYEDYCENYDDNNNNGDNDDDWRDIINIVDNHIIGMKILVTYKCLESTLKLVEVKDFVWPKNGLFFLCYIIRCGKVLKKVNINVLKGKLDGSVDSGGVVAMLGGVKPQSITPYKTPTISPPSPVAPPTTAAHTQQREEGGDEEKDEEEEGREAPSNHAFVKLNVDGAWSINNGVMKLRHRQVACETDCHEVALAMNNWSEIQIAMHANMMNFVKSKALKEVYLGWMEVTLDSITTLLSNCKIIESLVLKRCWNLSHFEIGNEALRLKRLVVDKSIFENAMFQLNAPNLCFFKYIGAMCLFEVKNTLAIKEAHLDFYLGFDNVGTDIFLYDLVQDLYNARVLSVCTYLLQVISMGEKEHIERDMNTRHLILKMNVHNCEFRGVSLFFHSCPMLERLTIELGSNIILQVTLSLSLSYCKKYRILIKKICIRISMLKDYEAYYKNYDDHNVDKDDNDNDYIDLIKIVDNLLRKVIAQPRILDYDRPQCL
ncbi:putative F-box protein [Spatholobus suberectus]|nr:putative F-box protein [Spatholobus suberectus]